MRKKSLRTAALLLAGAIVLQGCSLFRPTAASLTRKMYKNLEKVKSARMNTTVDSDIEIKHGALNVGLDVILHADSKADITKDPETSKADTDFSLEAFGQNISLKREEYTRKEEDGTQIVWSRNTGGKWHKKTTPPKSADSSGTQGQVNSEEQPGSSSGGSSISPIELLGILKELNETLKEADLKKELVTVNDRKAYQINLIVNGTLLERILRSREEAFKGFDPDSVNWDEISIPAELYIYKKGVLPARVWFDCRELGSVILGDHVKEALEGSLLENVDVDFRSLTVDAVFDNYNEIHQIVIPEEVIQAPEESNDTGLLPNLKDILGGF